MLQAPYQWYVYFDHGWSSWDMRPDTSVPWADYWPISFSARWQYSVLLIISLTYIRPTFNRCIKNDRHDVNHKLFCIDRHKENICIREWLRVILFSWHAFSKRNGSYLFNGQEQSLNGHLIKFLLNAMSVSTFPMLWPIRKQIWHSRMERRLRDWNRHYTFSLSGRNNSWCPVHPGIIRYCFFLVIVHKFYG